MDARQGDDAEGARKYTYTVATLTEEEMRALDPAGEQFNPGDLVALGGYVPEPGPRGGLANPAFDLYVNGVARHNWRHWNDLPPRVQERLKREKG